MKPFVLWVPLAIFVIFLLTVASGLYSPSDRKIPSRLVGKPVPEFALPAALPDKPGLAPADFKGGEPRILNVFASWCVPCIAEAPQLLALARRGIPIDAVALRDRPEDVAEFLGRWGDPYQRIGLDLDSQAQLALGSSGVPETFLIDGKGVIRYQHIGDIKPEHVAEIVRAYEAAK